MSHTNVKSEWVDGDLYFYDKSGNEIFHIDGTNRALVMNSAAGFTAPLEIDATDIAAKAVTADKIAAAAGTVLVGTKTSGDVTALDISASGAIPIGQGAGETAAAHALTGDVTMTNGGVTAIGAKKVTESMIALANHKVLIGDAGGAAAAMAVTGDVTISDSGVTAIGSAKVTSAMLASGAGLAAIVTAGLGNSATYIKTDTGTKTLLAANATKDRGVLVLVHIDETFATGDTSQLILKIGETDTIEKCAAAATFTDAAAGADFVFGFVNTSTKAIIATLTAAAGTGTGGASITVLALPNS